ncbi:MAG: sigma-70 family RNA polymerase sigma factor [Bacteroidales bacterium]|nr:sigma-70 family RNA polymerase sigma factor [Bacteroidales bacterium]
MDQFRESLNPDILGELFSPYMHLVYGVCLKYLKNRETAQDAVMQIFEKLLAELPKHDIKEFKPWLYVLTKNFCLMELRSAKSRMEREKKYTIEQETFMEPEERMHPLDEENSLLNTALQECIDKLKKEQKECIALFYYKDKCYQEIADILHIEEKKVKSHLQNGKRNLKICLEGKNVNYEQT